MDKFYLLSLDGTGQLSSYNINCPKCLTRNSEDDHKKTLFMHGQLVSSFIDVNNNISTTMAYEPIANDGETTVYKKNDCELNACKRLLKRLKSLYPKRSFCITADNLMATTTLAKKILNLGWHFIITAKPERNKELFSWYDYLSENKRKDSFLDKKGHTHEYTWSNKLPLKQEVREEDYFYVNLLEYAELDENKNLIYYNTWITDFKLNEGNVKKITQGGRARFAIENKTFNEQKTRGYQTEHNFGHFGNLPSVFFGLAQIAHIFSQLFSLSKIGKKLIQKVGCAQRFWERFATLFSSIILPDDGVPIFYIKLEIDSS